MRILYIDGDGPLGGASRSLYEIVRELKKGNVHPCILVAEGTVVPYYSTLTKDIISTFGLTRFDNTKYSYYRGVRWVIILRELIRLPSTFYSILQARRKWNNIDIIHINELTEIIPAIIAKKIFKVPLIIHSRSLSRKDNKSFRCRLIKKMLLKYVDMVVAIDENVHETLPSEIPITVIHNSFTPKYEANPDENFISSIKKLDPNTFKVGFVGNLLPGKGLIELIEAARILDSSGYSVDFLIVGDEIRTVKGIKGWILKKIGLSQNLKQEMIEKIDKYNLKHCFHMLGSTYDIQPVYEQFDVLCFPSHFDAPGRPIFEAAFSGVPSIAAINFPKADTLEHMETGIAIPPNNFEKLAEAILYLASNPEEVRRMGENAKKLAQRNFTPSINASKLLSVYNNMVKDNKY